MIYTNAGKEKTTAAPGMALRAIGHVVITGRGAKDVLIEEADLVAEMKQIKHPFRKGIKLRKGIKPQAGVGF